MSEYIKKEDAIASARALLFCYGSDNIPDDKLDEYAEEFINDDDNTIVEVVRCKYCKYSRVADIDDQEDGYLCSLLHGHEFFSYDYCSYGERKEQEHE